MCVCDVGTSSERWRYQRRNGKKGRSRPCSFVSPSTLRWICRHGICRLYAAGALLHSLLSIPITPSKQQQQNEIIFTSLALYVKFGPQQLGWQQTKTKQSIHFGETPSPPIHTHKAKTYSRVFSFFDIYKDINFQKKWISVSSSTSTSSPAPSPSSTWGLLLRHSHLPLQPWQRRW